MQSTVVWAVRLSIGKTRFRPPCGTKTRQPINTKFFSGDHVGEYIRSAKKVWEPFERWRPHAMAVCQTFVTVLPFFFQNQPTGQTQLSPTTYYASNDVVRLIHVPFGGKSSKISQFGGLRPLKPPKFPPNREILSETKMLNNLNGKR